MTARSLHPRPILRAAPRAALRRLLAAALLVLAGPAAAEQFERFGDLEVHYVVLNTTTLSPEMASRYDLPRDEDLALVNIAGRRVLGDGTTDPVRLGLEGRVSNLLGQGRDLDFEEVEDPGAIYYLATARFSDRETLRFELDVTDPATGKTHAMRFQKELWAQ